MRKDSSLQADGAKRHEASESERCRVWRGIRSAYDGSRVAVVLECLEAEDRTKQSFKDECDINVLMKRYERTGILPQGRDLPLQFADVSAMDFETSMQQVAEVRGVFSQLDARTRARFENDPSQMLDFLADPANNAEAVKLGLMAKPKETRDERAADSARSEGAGRAGEASAGDGAAGRKAVESDRGASDGGAVKQGTGEAGRQGKPAVGA